MNAFWVVAGLACLVAIWIIALEVGDYDYNKKMLRKEAPYRLPWNYRLAGWSRGSDFTSGLSKNGMFYDARIGKIVLIHRLGSWVYQRIFDH